jgi:hypothetical protein
VRTHLISIEQLSMDASLSARVKQTKYIPKAMKLPDQVLWCCCLWCWKEGPLQQLVSTLSASAVCGDLMAGTSHPEDYIEQDSATAHGRRYQAPQSRVAAATVASPLTGNR